MKPVVKWSLFGLALLLMVAVFAMYGRAEFLLTLSNQIWGCF